jgi:hypothetical protein
MVVLVLLANMTKIVSLVTLQMVEYVVLILNVSSQDIMEKNVVITHIALINFALVVFVLVKN